MRTTIGYPPGVLEHMPVQLLRLQHAARTGVTPEQFFAKMGLSPLQREMLDDYAATIQQKASVGGSDLTDAKTHGAGGDLFSQTLRTNSIIDALIANGATMAPDRVRLLLSGQAAVPAWVGNGRAIRMSKLDMNGTSLSTKSVGALTVATKESLEDASPEMPAILSRDLTNAIDDAVSETAIDPDNAGTDTTPESLTHGQTTIHSAGASVANVATDVNAALRELADKGSDLKNIVAVAHTRTAADLATKRDTAGGAAFPSVTPSGGTLCGVPLIVSGSVPNGGSPTATTLSFIDASDVVVVDRGIVVSLSSAATIEMSDAPTGVSSGTPVAASQTIVSMFQADAVAIKVVRRITWELRRGLVVVIDGVAY